MSYPTTPHPNIHNDPNFQNKKPPITFQQPPVQPPNSQKLHPQMARNSSPLDRTVPTMSPMPRGMNQNHPSKSGKKHYNINLNISVNNGKSLNKPIPQKQHVQPFMQRPPSNPPPFINRFPHQQPKILQPVTFPVPPMKKNESPR